VDDNAAVFLNGVRVGRHEGWDEPFGVPLRAAWNPSGPNQLVVLVQNTAGAGGIMGPVSLETTRPQPAPAESRPSYDDRAWRHVHLPHDYVVEGRFDPSADTSHGSLPTPPAWYRKSFVLPAADRGKSAWIDFDGIYRQSTIWLNGQKLGEHSSGYASFRCDISRLARFGGRNVLAIRVDPRRHEGWWYEGGGIYRHVWLNIADPVHVAPWGTFVQATVRGPEGQARPAADLSIRTTVANDTGRSVDGVVLRSRILAPDGKLAATAVTTFFIPARSSAEVMETAGLANTALWSIETPRLYRLETTLSRGGREVDRTVTPFGVRTIRFDAANGFFLNGRPVKLKGTCNHQDFAGMGIGIPDSLLEWRIQKLKEMGSNAYRCSHNPPAAELLDACDRLGMVVMDETRHLGDTSLPKTPRGTKATVLSELKSMLPRDRNHPSVIMWSMCNEEPLQGSPEGAAIFAAMKAVVRRLDPTRPVTEAMNGGWGRGITDVTDLQGINYGIFSYDRFHEQFPKLPVFGSETASTVSTRGIYANDRERGYVIAYDVNAPPWGATAEAAWKPIAERPFMAGAFVWTGFDYKGEPTPYGWPCINSHFGIMDMCGFPKDNWYYYKAWWGEEPSIHILPHWNWPGKEGQPIAVWVHSNADRVELFLNGQSLGVKEMPRYGHLEWEVNYAPGTLVAKGITLPSGGARGSEVVTDRVETTGTPAAIRLKADRTRLSADGEDAAAVAVEIVDAQGRVVPVADNLVQFSITGAGSIAGVGNGDPSSHEPDRASRRRAFNGRCMAIVQANDTPGQIVLRANSPGLKGTALSFSSMAVRLP
jgi:beta-galactosidase